MCKKLMYKILHCKKLDWLKKEKSWKFDKIDHIIGITLGSLFILAIIYGKTFLYLLFFSILPFSIIGEIRHIKNTPGDIESKLMYPLMCLGYIFYIFWSLMLVSILSS